MKKLLLLFIIPFLSFGQGLNFKLGSTVLIPLHNYEENSFNTSWGTDIKTKLGFQGSIAYDFTFNNISEKFSVSPALSYSLINYLSYATSVIISDETWKHHHLQFSVISGYRVTDLITTKFGVSLDSKISNSVKGRYTYQPETPHAFNENDPIIDELYEESADLEGVNNEFEILGFSSHFSLEFRINKVVSVFSNLQLPVLNFDDINSVPWFSRGQAPRRYWTLGLGFSI